MLNDFQFDDQNVAIDKVEAFLKSIKRLRTEPALFSVVNHLCRIEISACVV